MGQEEIDSAKLTLTSIEHIINAGTPLVQHNKNRIISSLAEARRTIDELAAQAESLSDLWQETSDKLMWAEKDKNASRKSIDRTVTRNRQLELMILEALDYYDDDKEKHHGDIVRMVRRMAQPLGTVVAGG